MRWRQIPMSRDDVEMTMCGRGTIRRKVGTATMWKVRVKIGGQLHLSHLNFTKSMAKKWVENKINEKTNFSAVGNGKLCVKCVRVFEREMAKKG